MVLPWCKARIRSGRVCRVSVSCSSGDDYSSPLKNKTMSDITFDASASSNTIQFGDADLSKLTVLSSETWCKASVVGKTIVVNADANDTYGERSATVTINDSGDGSTTSFKVTQKQNNAILVDKSTYEVGEEGGTLEIGVQSNVSYNVEIINADWITRASNTRGLEKSTITLKVDKNTSGDVREASVKISDSASGETSTFTIKQAFNPVFSIDKNSLSFDENGGEGEVTVNTNLDIDTSVSDNWVEIASKDKKEENVFIYKLKVKAMGSTIRSRKADITFTNTKWNVAEKLTISQIKSLYIEDTNLEIYIGDSYSLSLVNNIGGTVSWASSDTSVATVDSKGKVTGVGKGTAKISVTSSDGKYSDEISVSVIQDLSIQEETIELLAGEKHTLKVVNKTGGVLTWKSSNTSVASVNSSGEVTGVSRGNATITATSADGSISATCSVTVKDITDFITANSAGGSVFMTNDLIQYGSTLNWTFNNNSTETVTLKSLQLVDGQTGNEGNIMTVDEKVAGGSSVSYSVTIGLLGIHTPVTCRFRYEYKGKEYMTTAEFKSYF